jgi:hypothetical protein
MEPGKDSRRWNSSAPNQSGACTTGLAPGTKDRRCYWHVDGIVVAAQSNAESDEVMKGLRRRWKITELGEVSTILGLKVRRDRQARKAGLTQPAYIERVVDLFP